MRVQYVCIMGLLLACALLAYCVPHGADLLKTSALHAFESHIALASPRLVEDGKPSVLERLVGSATSVEVGHTHS